MTTGKLYRRNSSYFKKDRKVKKRVLVINENVVHKGCKNTALGQSVLLTLPKTLFVLENNRKA